MEGYWGEGPVNSNDDYVEEEETSLVDSDPEEISQIRTISSSSIWDLHDRESYHEIILQSDGTYKLKETFVSQHGDQESLKIAMEHMTEQDELSFKRSINYLSEEEKRRIDIKSPEYQEKRDELGQSHWSYTAEACGKFLVGFENALILLNDDGSVPDHSKYSPEDLERAQKRIAENKNTLPTPIANKQRHLIPLENRPTTIWETLFYGGNTLLTMIFNKDERSIRRLKYQIADEIDKDPAALADALHKLINHPFRNRIISESVGEKPHVVQQAVDRICVYESDKELNRLDVLAGEDEDYRKIIRSSLIKWFEQEGKKLEETFRGNTDNGYKICRLLLDLPDMPNFSDICNQNYLFKAIKYLDARGELPWVRKIVVAYPELLKNPEIKEFIDNDSERQRLRMQNELDMALRL